MKTRQRLDYNRLAEALGERGLVPPQTLQHVLSQCVSSGGLFPEILVRESHVSDWELSRVVCEVFGLPYLTTAFYTPDADAAEGIDRAFLHEYAIVPLDRFGKLLTVAMPGLTPSQILSSLSESAGVEILPVVGSVEGNREWLGSRLPLPNALTAGPEDAAADVGIDAGEFALTEDSLAELEENWNDLFDEGDAAVLLGLDGGSEDGSGREPAQDARELDASSVPIPDLGDVRGPAGSPPPDDEESEAPPRSTLDLPELPSLPSRERRHGETG